MTDESSGIGPPSASSIRPYLARHGDGPAQQADDGDDPNVSPLRPYLLTAGRSEPIDDTLEIEAQVLTNQLDAASAERLAFEHRDIVTLCATPVSVAEVAAKLRLHIGVARVLVADLAAAGYLVVRRPSSGLPEDLDMIEKVIRGLQDIR
jgi:hypothetical protein